MPFKTATKISARKQHRNKHAVRRFGSAASHGVTGVTVVADVVTHSPDQRNLRRRLDSIGGLGLPWKKGDHYFPAQK
jgi:hypothetical protein